MKNLVKGAIYRAKTSITIDGEPEDFEFYVMSEVFEEKGIPSVMVLLLEDIEPGNLKVVEELIASNPDFHFRDMLEQSIYEIFPEALTYENEVIDIIEGSIVCWDWILASWETYDGRQITDISLKIEKP